MILSSSLEDYLEAIYDIEITGHEVRITDIGTKLGVEKSSVNYAVNKLCNLKLVLHEPYTDIKLTSAGRKTAKLIKNRHDIIKKFLKNVLLLSEEISDNDACRMEHILSPETFENLSKFVDFYENLKSINNKDIDQLFRETIVNGQKN
ncbi:MAG TPA: metal-dependent transcriptional regulator [Spirochaetota bacterium]|nr:metal-dependent transcriptional regulator [Spirochaetota bacterium]